MSSKNVNAEELVAAIQKFQENLPEFWFTVGSCSVSRDASCGPDWKGADAYLNEIVAEGRHIFDDGFHCDDREGTMADSLLTVMQEALEAKAKYA